MAEPPSSFIRIDCFLLFVFVALAWVRIQHIIKGKKLGRGQRVREEKSIVIQPRQKGREYWSWGLAGALESYSQ